MIACLPEAVPVFEVVPLGLDSSERCAAQAMQFERHDLSVLIADLHRIIRCGTSHVH